MGTPIFAAAAFASGVTIDRVLQNRLSEYPRFPAALLLSLAACAFLLMVSSDPLVIAKGLLLAEPMIAVSFCDGLTHEIPNLLLLPILAAGFLNFHPAEAVFGFFIASLPFLAVSVLTRGGIGGGDIKLAAAAGFALGPVAVIGGSLVGLTAFLPFGLICRRCKHKSIPYALAPWLCSGCFFAYLLNH